MIKTIQVNTNIHCQSCIDKLKPHFENESQIEYWKVDLESELKTLSISGVNIQLQVIESLLAMEGYSIVNQGHSHEKNTSFWSHRKKWKRASFNTLNCLIGCSIGDFGMIIFLQAFYPNTPMIWQMVWAIIAGLMTSISLETLILKQREGFDLRNAFKTAMGMSFISMIGMEIAMNTTDFMITGGKAAFDDPKYWVALLMAMIAGFLAPLPFNYYRLQRFNQSCH